MKISLIQVHKIYFKISLISWRNYKISYCYWWVSSFVICKVYENFIINHSSFCCPLFSFFSNFHEILRINTVINVCYWKLFKITNVFSIDLKIESKTDVFEKFFWKIFIKTDLFKRELIFQVWFSTNSEKLIEFSPKWCGKWRHNQSMKRQLSKCNMIFSLVGYLIPNQ
jgi:hypothetical protein